MTTSALPDMPGVRAGLTLRALVGSRCCLIVHTHGPCPAAALDHTGTAVWHVGSTPDCAASTDVSPDLVVIDLNGIDEDMRLGTVTTMLDRFTDAATTPRIALVFDSREEAAAPSPVTAATPTEAGESIAERHQLLIETDRLQGLLARTIRLQDEADYWRLKFEHAGVPSKDAVRVANREAVDRAVARVKADRRYRIGAAVLWPFGAIRRLARRIRRGS